MISSIWVLVLFAVQIFCTVLVSTSDCTPIPVKKRSVFKWFLTTLAVKYLFQLATGSIVQFTTQTVLCPQAVDIVYDQSIFLLNLKLCSELMLLSCPSTNIDQIVFSAVHQVSVVLIASMSSFVEPNSSYLILLSMSVFTSVFSVISCCLELTIILLLFSISFVLQLWLSEAVLVGFQTVLWIGVLVWFLNDKRGTYEQYSSSVAEIDFETIELT